jgi:transcriptional regulator with XRE-family HTH domain
VATTSEADQLAAVLRQLKERSGLSYGVLAGKLHVSTSTLHRYCNGDAVPAEFSSVERLARLCGAQREELIDLHRRWILADEARRRGRAGAETAAAAAREAVPETAPAAAREAVPETAVTADGPARPPAAEEPELPPATGESAEAAPPGTSSRRKRLVVALAAAAVVALAVPVAVVASNTGDSGDPEASAGGPAGAVAPTGAASRSASPSGSASPSTSASPSSSPDASTSPRGATPSAEASRQSKAPAGTGGVPLRVGISSYNWASPCGQYYLFDGKPDSVPPPPPAPQDRRRWAGVLGGVDAGRMHLQLTATGRTEDSVVINAVHVRTVARNAALAWNVYSMGEGCGSGVTPQTFDIDLDAAGPVAKPVAGTDGDLTVPAKDFPYKVASNDPQVLNFDVHTEGHDVSWYLEVAWSSGDRSGSIRVDDGGKPFRTSAAEGRPMYDYWPDKGEWVAR